MISYCIAAYRPTYVRLLLADLVAKTTAPFEILVWLNVADAALDADIEAAINKGVPLRVIGRTPENIGMLAYASLFRAARYPLITQIDDDIVFISRGIAERADRLFRRFPTVGQLVSDVWQDEYTTGARPPLDHYVAFDASEGLYSGPIDGWFAVYNRSILPILLDLTLEPYCGIGGMVHGRLRQRGLHGLLDRGMKVFHVIGPAYASAFGMLEFEIAKYRRLGKREIVDWYESYRNPTASRGRLAGKIDFIRTLLDRENEQDHSAALPGTLGDLDQPFHIGFSPKSMQRLRGIAFDEAEQFGLEIPADVRLVDGWTAPCEDGLLTVGHESRLELPRPVVGESYVLALDVSPFTDAPAPPAQRLAVVLNGEVLSEIVLISRRLVRCRVPRRTVESAEKLAITLLHPDATPLASASNPLDDRALSMILHSLTLSPASVHARTGGTGADVPAAGSGATDPRTV